MARVTLRNVIVVVNGEHTVLRVCRFSHCYEHVAGVMADATECPRERRLAIPTRETRRAYNEGMHRSHDFIIDSFLKMATFGLLVWRVLVFRYISLCPTRDVNICHSGKHI